jgi:hypothetical protein
VQVAGDAQGLLDLRMEKAKLLAVALRKTAARLRTGVAYQWGHMGQCNCGHLAQTLCGWSAAEIHRSALLQGTGEWTEHAYDYCSGSGALIDDVVDQLLAAGLSRDDIADVENLSNRQVLTAMKVGMLERNNRDHAIAYFDAWADLLDPKLAEVTTLVVERKSRAA